MGEEHYNIGRAQYTEIETLVSQLNYHLVSLATALKGRLHPEEQEMLAYLFQVQVDLRTSLKDLPPRVNGTGSAAETQNKTNDLAYAQTLQYARDLAKIVRKTNEQQRRLELTSQQLIRAEKLAIVGQVATTVAHELDNILAPLLMYAKLIYHDTDKNGSTENSEFSTQIARITQRASNMLRQLMNAGHSASTPSVPVNLVHIIQNSLALLSARIKKQNINVQQRFPDNLPLVMGNANQLEQVFINLILNALDAMPKGGNLTMTLKTESQASNLQVEQDYIMICIQDSGVGIPPENIDLLFEPFYTTKTQGAASGLGLFVSHLIVDRYGGTIEVESELGNGTCFMIKLPTIDKVDNDGVYSAPKPGSCPSI